MATFALSPASVFEILSKEFRTLGGTKHSENVALLFFFFLFLSSSLSFSLFLSSIGWHGEDLTPQERGGK